MKHIVKRAGHSEEYDPKKLYASVYCASLSVREPVGSAELIAQKVVDELGSWITNKHQVTSDDIRRMAAKHLVGINPDAGQIYKNHREFHK